MRVACLFLPHFALRCELQSRENGASTIKVAAIVDERRVLEASPAAQRYGIKSGQLIEEALAACPYLVTFNARPVYYERRFKIVLDRLAELSPRVESGSLGVAYIDLAGLDRHYSRPGSLEQKLLACASAGLLPRLGIGPGKFPAFIAAYRARRGQSREFRECDVRPALAPVSVDLLPVSFEMKHQLDLLGIRTLGALAGLPRHAVAARFGPEGTLAWDLANGVDPSAVRSAQAPPTVSASRFFIDPITSRELLIAAIEQLLQRTQRELLRDHQAARIARLTIELEGSREWEKQITFKEPRQDRTAIWAAIRPVIENAELAGAVTSARIEFSELTSTVGWQTEFWPHQRRSALWARQERLTEALRQLKARYGVCPVGKVVEVEPWSRIPERRAAIIAFDP